VGKHPPLAGSGPPLAWAVAQTVWRDGLVGGLAGGWGGVSLTRRVRGKRPAFHQLQFPLHLIDGGRLSSLAVILDAREHHRATVRLQFLRTVEPGSSRVWSLKVQLNQSALDEGLDPLGALGQHAFQARASLLGPAKVAVDDRLLVALLMVVASASTTSLSANSRLGFSTLNAGIRQVERAPSRIAMYQGIVTLAHVSSPARLILPSK
jgi:hypothetical protein